MSVLTTIKRLAQPISAALRRLKIPTDLAPEHPYGDSLSAARAYNQRRSAESGKTIADANRILNFHIILDLVKQLPEGCYAELGTYRGLTASVIFDRRAAGATLYCFDTFEGFDARDLDDTRLDAGQELDAFAGTSVGLVRQRIAGGEHSELKLRPGFFPATFAGLEDRRFRFAHIDLDLAAPIQAALEILWPRMVTGGALLVHDYYSARYPMARETVDAFFAARGITVLGLNDRLGTALVIKQPGMA